MKKIFAPLAIAAVFFAACGDTVENVSQINHMGMDIVDSEDELPECTDENEGDQAYVKGETYARLCVDGKWLAIEGGKDTIVVAGDTVFLGGGDFSCKTEELADKSGLKIVCNGDSIGVVLNGTNGEDGKKGEEGDGCTITQNDTAVTVTCGDKTTTIKLGAETPADTSVTDTSDSEVSLDSLAGYSQKGPFLKGSRVFLYELDNGRTLKQTNGNFTSYITSDNGRYKFTSRNVRPYAIIIVDGNYRNEVTGAVSDQSIRLQALCDVRKHRSDGANVNILTHMEYERVYYLVTQKGYDFEEAKQTAQADVLKAFHIELDAAKDAESLNIFGKTDADAALLAISVLLQGDLSVPDMMVLLTEISNELAEDGEWSDTTGRAATLKASIADWVLSADSAGRLAQIGPNVTAWGFGEAPDFEKFVHKFAKIESGLGDCDKDSVGRVKAVPNPKSNAFYAKTYTDTSRNVPTRKVRFICKDLAGEYKWQVASNIEKDTLTWGHTATKGSVRRGQINADLVYVYEDDNWRHGTVLDDTAGVGCILTSADTVVKGSNNVWYKCIGDTTMQYAANGLTESAWKSSWRKANNIERDTVGFGHTAKNGDVRKGADNKDLVYVYEEGYWRHGTVLDDTAGVGCILTSADTVVKGSNNVWYKCIGDTTMQYAANGLTESAWKSSWRKANNIERDTVGFGHTAKNGDVRKGADNKDLVYVYENGNWRHGDVMDGLIGKGCFEGRKDTLVQFEENKWFKCVGDTTVQYIANGQIESTWEHAWRSIDGDELDLSFWMYYKNERGEFVVGPYSGGIRVWDNGQFREPNEHEIELGRACVSYILHASYELSDGLSHSCVSSGAWSREGTFQDDRYPYDFYWAVHIGDQIWMAENLKYVTENSVCLGGASPDCATHGRGYTIAEARKNCPTGWHLPDTTEWNELFDFVIKEGRRPIVALRATWGWECSVGNEGTDDYGFSALPSVSGTSYTFFWTDTFASNGVFAVYMTTYGGGVSFGQYASSSKMAVRCLKDRAPTSGNN